MFKLYTNENNFFYVMDMNPSFNIDLNYLESNYIQHIKIKNEKTKIVFHLNQAYYTLKDPLLRANYLLQIFNIENKKDGSSNNFNMLSEILHNKEKLSKTKAVLELKIIKKISLNKNRFLLRLLSLLFNLINFLQNKTFSKIIEVVHEFSYYDTYLTEINEKICKDK